MLTRSKKQLLEMEAQVANPDSSLPPDVLAFFEAVPSCSTPPAPQVSTLRSSPRPSEQHDEYNVSINSPQVPAPASQTHAGSMPTPLPAVSYGAHNSPIVGAQVPEPRTPQSQSGGVQPPLPSRQYSTHNNHLISQVSTQLAAPGQASHYYFAPPPQSVGQFGATNMSNTSVPQVSPEQFYVYGQAHVVPPQYGQFGTQDRCFVPQVVESHAPHPLATSHTQAWPRPSPQFVDRQNSSVNNYLAPNISSLNVSQFHTMSHNTMLTPQMPTQVVSQYQAMSQQANGPRFATPQGNYLTSQMAVPRAPFSACQAQAGVHHVPPPVVSSSTQNPRFIPPPVVNQHFPMMPPPRAPQPFATAQQGNGSPGSLWTGGQYNAVPNYHYAAPPPPPPHYYQPVPNHLSQQPVFQHEGYPLAPNYQTYCNVNDLAKAIASQKRSNNIMKLPTFSGKPIEWFIFRRIYDRTKMSYDVTENLTRLSAALQGPAHEAVATLLATADDAELVIEALHQRFGQPEVIVSQLVTEIRAMPRLTGYDCLRELNAFSCKVNNYVNVVRLLGQNEYLASPELVSSILAKLPVVYKEKWFDFAFKNKDTGKFKLQMLSEFLSHEAWIHTAFGGTSTASTLGKVGNNPTMPAKINVVDSSDPNDRKATPSGESTNVKGCLLCNSLCRTLSECKQFLAMSVTNRLQWAIDNKICRKCLKRGGHSYRACKRVCSVTGCKNKFSHHSLHEERDVTAHVSTESEEEEEEQQVNHSWSEDEIDDELVAHTNPENRYDFHRPLLKVIPVTISGSKGSLNTYALLDDGSTATLIDRGAAEAIGAVGEDTLLRVDGVGGVSKVHSVQYINLKIKGRYSDEIHELKSVRSIPDLCLGNQSVQKFDIQKASHLEHLVKELCYEEAQPLLLIGNDNWPLTIAQATIRGTPSQPVAIRTALGWVVYGYATKKCTPVERDNINFTKDRELDELVREHYKLESIGVTQKEFHSIEDQRAIEILNQTTRRLPSGRFETGLLWNSDVGDVPRSYELALTRFLSLERKFKRDTGYAKTYKENIKATIDKGYAELCVGPPDPKNVNWYLPHFGVLHPQKKKLRVVHDAAAECRGVSLNKLLLTGPDILRPLLSVLMQFREPLIAINGDIREMFPQTKIRIQDCDAQRFLWRDDPSEEIAEYRMSSMIFGAASSPFTAQFLKNRNAEDHKKEFPAAAAAIIDDHYMDDFLGGADSVDEAARLACDIVHVHGRAGLEMRSWVSNDPRALSLLPDDLKAPESTDHVGVLGMRWDVRTDTLTPLRSTCQPPQKFTKRLILSHLMKVYDPLGLLTPIVIKGRVLFQRIWRLGVGWDDQLPSEIIAEWSHWSEELMNIGKELSIPRCYFTQGNPVNIQLHVLADASELCYACVAYWRYTFIGGVVKTSLIGGKSRLAPLKPVSIPRLELQAALIAARFSKFIVEAHKRKPNEIFYWTDSMTVLNWLKSDGRTFKPFVAHRVGEILEMTMLSGWRYVPTAMNVADDATRFKSKFKILSSRWFSGPPFLALPYAEWPNSPIEENVSIPEELKSQSEHVALIRSSNLLPLPIVPNITRFSSWNRLVHTTARVFLVAKSFRSLIVKNHIRRHEPLTLEPNDITRAETRLFLCVQMESFKEDYEMLRSEDSLPTKSRLKRLDLFIGEDFLIRLSGRTAAAKVAGFSANPILLDAKHPIVSLLIIHYHRKFLHGNNETVVNEMRQRYYIFGLRPSVKRAARACALCRLRRATPVTPPVGNLPQERVAAYERPFTFTGVDYFGPVSVSVGRRSEKRYVALFTCLTVRAVHLEIVHDLSADSAIMALRRFISRRGAPTTIFSDNGTAFVCANNILTQLRSAAVSTWKIKWSFIPPSSPFMGGCWERLVRSVKTALSATLKERSPREDVFGTLLTEAEALINSRPLTHVSTDPNDEEAVTPFHFLIGTSSPYEPLTEVNEADLIRRVNWKKGLRLADHFWARWVKEYLPSLTPRSNKDSSQQTVKIGDLVLIADGNLPRGVWPKGRVVALHPGKDGITRVVTVDTRSGQLRRPVRKLVLLC